MIKSLDLLDTKKHLLHYPKMEHILDSLVHNQRPTNLNWKNGMNPSFWMIAWKRMKMKADHSPLSHLGLIEHCSDYELMKAQMN